MQVVCPLWSVSGFHLEMRCVPCKAKQQRTRRAFESFGIIRTWHCHGTAMCAMQSATPPRPIHQFSHRRTVPLRRDALDVFLLHSMPPRQDVLHLQKKCCFKRKLTTRHKGVSFLKQSKVAVSQNHSILRPIQEEMEKSSSLNGSFMPIRRKHAAMP